MQFRFETGAVSKIVNNPEVVTKSAAFITVLIRVPAAYPIINRYRAGRPGLLFLDAGGNSWGSVLYSTSEAAEKAIERTLAGMTAVLGGRKLANASECGFVGIVYTLDNTEGDGSAYRLLVTSVAANSPAAKAGIEAGDFVLAIDGRRGYGELDEVTEVLTAWENNLSPGNKVRLIVERGEQVLVVDLVAARVP